MRLILEGVVSRPRVNRNGIRSVSNKVNIICPIASTSISSRARTRRLRNQKRVLLWPRVNRNRLRGISNRGDTIYPIASTSISRKP